MGAMTMVDVVAEFFQITGLDMIPPQNLAELIPYLLKVVVAVCLVSGFFWVIGKFVDICSNWRRW